MKTMHTVDVAVVVDGRAVVLIRRADPPFMDRLVLPGGHVDPTDASFEAAACRETEEEIGLSLKPSELRFLMVLDGEGRDPRPGRRISRAFRADVSAAEFASCVAGSDAASLELREIASLTPSEIGFDHWRVISSL